MLPWFDALFGQLTGRFLAARLHHALLLAGPAGIGKARFAVALAQMVLCRQTATSGACGSCQSCQLFAANTHPDFHMLQSEKQLGVDAVRGGIATLGATAQLGHNKVLLIKGADTMTESASNALLKTLEEPTNNTFIILLTDKLTRLLPTILSRCEKHKLGVPAVSESLAWLQEQGCEDVDEALLQAYGYAPLRVQAAVADSNALSFRAYSDGFAQLMTGDITPLALATKWQDNASQIVTWCQQQAYKAYCQRQQRQDLACFERCQQAIASLQHPGINKAVVLCGVLEQFAAA
ncbi:DNA polymerase III subunit delta' [Alteromonas halophila]|uniref:DNA-directed DNA polymerase n=1 Tax=Alteromonas halophila TaxID=516698 RepID=A0A918JEK1_9ALTE|nr:DNA polymerase III subunit delta' [Alteromonas halophila]GGW76872.1 hypothetical protein GCM10007391_07160 [Alteromonas halophila]